MCVQTNSYNFTDITFFLSICSTLHDGACTADFSHALKRSREKDFFEALGSYATVPVEPKARRYDHFVFWKKCQNPQKVVLETVTLQEINISHLGKRKIIFKYAIFGGYVSSLEGIIPKRKSRNGNGMIEKYIALPRISITICFLGIHEIQQCPLICVRKKNFN